MRETGSVTWWATIDTESVSDSGSSNTVLAVTVALILLGVGLLVVTAWFWRSTRPDPEALGPLVAMSDRRFVTLGPIEKRRALDEARPAPETNEVAPVVVDDEPADDEPSVDDFGNDAEPIDELIDELEVESVAVVLDDEPEIDVPTVVDEPDSEIEPEDEPDAVDHEPTPRPRPIDPLL